MAVEGSHGNALQYAGERWDSGAGLLYLRAHWYDPSTGHFLTPDPFPGFAALPQTQHPYVYVGNNPINLTDPSGEFAFLPLLAVASAGGILGGVGYYALKTYIPQLLNPCVERAEWKWEEAFLWSGAGLVIGAALGGGIYGGRWIWTTYGPAAAAAGGMGGGVAARQAGQRAGSVWQLSPLARGVRIHALLGQNLPHNFPRIDRFVGGIATSTKSIDLNATTYQNTAALMSKVQGYINILASFQGAQLGNISVTSGQISRRVLELAIPPGATQSQWKILQQLQQYAANLGVTLNIVVVP